MSELHGKMARDWSVMYRIIFGIIAIIWVAGPSRWIMNGFLQLSIDDAIAKFIMVVLGAVTAGLFGFVVKGPKHKHNAMRV